MEIKKNLIELRKQAEVNTNDTISTAMSLALNMGEKRLLREAEAIYRLISNPMAKYIFYSSQGERFDGLFEIRNKLRSKARCYLHAAHTIWELNQEINRISNNI